MNAEFLWKNTYCQPELPKNTEFKIKIIINFINNLQMKPDKIYLTLFLLLILTSVSWISSCTHTTDITGLPEVCFESDVLPIFERSCAMANCHSSGSEESLTSYNDIVRHVVPGNAQKSSIYQVITSAWGMNRMPPDLPLSIDNRTIIRLWIEQGATNPVCPPTVAIFSPLTPDCPVPASGASTGF
jgi:hypothetical protein